MRNNIRLTLFRARAIIFLLDMSALLFTGVYALADKFSSYLKRLRSNNGHR